MEMKKKEPEKETTDPESETNEPGKNAKQPAPAGEASGTPSDEVKSGDSELKSSSSASADREQCNASTADQSVRYNSPCSGGTGSSEGEPLLQKEEPLSSGAPSSPGRRPPSDQSLKTDGDNGPRSQELNLSLCGRRTRLEKILLPIIIFLILTTLSFLVALITVSERRRDGAPPITPLVTSPTQQPSERTTSELYCPTPACIRAAAHMIQSIDPKIDPCEDFYSYACGGWQRTNVIPEHKDRYNSFGKLIEEVQILLKYLMDEPVLSNDTVAVINVKHMYASCMNTTLIEKRGVKPLLDLLASYGGWPVLNANWDESAFDLTTTMARLVWLAGMKDQVLFRHGAGPDLKYSDVNIIQFEQPMLGLPSRDYFLEKGLAYDAYIEAAYRTAVALGANNVTARKDMLDAIEFEAKIANMTATGADKREYDKFYNRFTIAEMYTNLTDQIDWLKYLQLIYKSVDITININQTVLVHAKDYIKQLGLLLKQTSRRTVANYVLWRVVMIRISSDSLPKHLLDIHSNLTKALIGTSQTPPRWQTCVASTNDLLGLAVGKMFVEKHFNPLAKKHCLKMIEGLQAAFNVFIDDAEWMDEPTRAKAREKADVMTTEIGYPEFMLSDSFQARESVGIVVEPTTFFENSLSVLEFSLKDDFRQLALPVDKFRWRTSPAVVTARHMLTRNQIIFYAGILQPPFYHADYPSYLNYGGIGMVIGHEISHGFDVSGRKFDKNGNMQQWWPNDVIERFNNATECILNQYGNYTVESIGKKLNSRLTLGEDIADNGGLKQAYQAYTRLKETADHPELPLPGLNRTADQLFFLNFAQLWCTLARPEYSLKALRIDPHSPGRYRVNGPASNSKDFAAAYHCPSGSKMNPIKKCKVW